MKYVHRGTYDSLLDGADPFLAEAKFPLRLFERDLPRWGTPWDGPALAAAPEAERLVYRPSPADADPAPYPPGYKPRPPGSPPTTLADVLAAAHSAAARTEGR